ncbi:MAG: DUF2029 domain-containing protein [Phycisphaerales bacterium]|nr:DUF2029 domain-containing protein [Phycisphaerales bacterium]
MSSIVALLTGHLSTRYYFVGLSTFFLLFAGTFYSSFYRLSRDRGDFNQLIEDGRLATETRQLGKTLPLEYPPTARPLFMLLAAPPPTWSLVFWWFINAWFYWQSAVWLSREIVTDGQGWKTLLPAFALIGLTSVGIVSDLSVGQLTGLILFCVVGSFELDRRGYSLAGGALLAISLLVKPLPAVLLLYYLLRRRWRFLCATIATFILIGPLLLTVLFGWNAQVEGWRWFAETTARQRSPLHVFHRWGDMPGMCLTFRESGLASSLIRLCMEVTYDKHRHNVQLLTLQPGILRILWFLLVGLPLAWAACSVTRRKLETHHRFHAFAAMTGIMMLSNPKFISYWLAVPLVTIAPLAVCVWRTRRKGGADWICFTALLIWLFSNISLGFPMLRAAGSIPFGLYAITLANLIRSQGDNEDDAETPSSDAEGIKHGGK